MPENQLNLQNRFILGLKPSSAIKPQICYLQEDFNWNKTVPAVIKFKPRQITIYEWSVFEVDFGVYIDRHTFNENS
jgi:hypothetical protein